MSQRNELYCSQVYGLGRWSRRTRRNGQSGHHQLPACQKPYARRIGDLASVRMRDNDVPERAKAQPSELNHE